MNFFNVKRLSETAVIPSRGSKNAAGYDLYANENVFVPIWAGVLVSTGIAISFPDGHYARVASRSGLSVKSFSLLLISVILARKSRFHSSAFIERSRWQSKINSDSSVISLL
jgi:dUTPase